MSNRTLFFTTLLVIVSMGILFFLNMNDILTGQPPNQDRLKYNNVQGMAVQYNQLLFTLNFQQQNKIIQIINEAVTVNEIKEGNHSPSPIQKLIIYPVEGKDQITLTPITYVDKNMIFSAPEWAPNGYLMELSYGELKELLSQTYDPSAA